MRPFSQLYTPPPALFTNVLRYQMNPFIQDKIKQQYAKNERIAENLNVSDLHGHFSDHIKQIDQMESKARKNIKESIWFPKI